MSHIRGMVVNLRTADGNLDGTDDNIYIGVVGTGGGREFPLGTAGFDDYEKGSDVTYALGTVWDGNAISDPEVKNPRFSSNNDANDPGPSNIILNDVNQVYIRKAGSRKFDGDNEYGFLSVRVTLYGSNPESRVFETVTRSKMHLANVTGLQIWLREIETA
jgi:hypothetical protein